MDFLGRGLLIPFQRDEKNDFANGADEQLIASHIVEILGMHANSGIADGELQWDTARGSRLYLLVQSQNDDVLAELAFTYVVEALDQFLPEVIVRKVSATRTKDDFGRQVGVQIRVRYDLKGFTANQTPEGQFTVGVFVS